MARTRAQKQKEQQAQEQKQKQDHQHQQQQKDDPPQCFLFKIPGELRNRIYREVLVKDEHIKYDASGYQRPALLATNKEIRAEAMSIFYYENTFMHDVDHYDSSAMMKFDELLLGMNLDRRRMMIQNGVTYDQPSWKNLIMWLSRFHAKAMSRCPGPALFKKEMGMTRSARYFIGGMFDTVEKMVGVEFEVVLGLMEIWRPALAAFDKKWEQDEDEE
ncbi:hypothetical protein CLAFUW4_14019 [Fulvia fulva]|nr:hypothetical protein CLAFUR4_14022 [Fulvia fulva]KAK4611163.1 hypothetical protein CLAFUR0_14026 [Fulvia fulva]WPV21762.1 hypothetical protein CLAFUW4_14019 [Fulvia fulva]